jgi:hypothetical protein
MPTVDENSYLFQQQQMVDDKVDKVARSYCGAGEGGWCNYVVHEEQLQRYPPAMLCIARVCRVMLMFFITFCVIGLITGWALEGSMTVLEEIDTKSELQVPSLAVCPQPWGSAFKGDITVKDAHIISIPGGKEGPELKWKTVQCPTGTTTDEGLYDIDGYTDDIEGYTGIQTARGHGSQQQQKQKEPQLPSFQAPRSGSLRKEHAKEKTAGSEAKGNASMLKSPRSAAQAPHSRNGTALTQHASNASASAKGAEPQGGKPPLSHRHFLQEEIAPPRSAFLRLLLKKSALSSVSSVSLLQDEKVDHSSSHAKSSSLLESCFCVNLEENVLTFRGERGNVKDLDYVTLSLGNLANSNALNKQYAFGFYLGAMLPQQWSYGDAGQILEGDLRSEEVATGKTEFSDGTAVPRFGFRKSGASQSPDGTTTLVFGYDKYLSYVMASFASKYSFFAMMTLVITCCAAINNFGLFEIVFPERSDDGPPELEPNLALRSILGYCCYCCTVRPEVQQKEEQKEEEAA